MMSRGRSVPGGREDDTRWELDVRYLGDPVLRRTAEPVAGVDGELRELVTRMFDTMYAVDGQGLAAPQVGRSLRLAVVDVPPDGPPHVLVNPRITWASAGRDRGVEGCLSVPGARAVVERPAEVVVEALDLDWNLQTLGADGELARCFQHEIDHLDGILYIDRLSPLNRRMTVSRYRKSTRRSGRPTRKARHDRGWPR
jgi:peptide deformylase